MLTYDTPALRQTGSRNLTGQKTLPTIWGTYMKLVTKYQISGINSCWEKYDGKWAYMFNVYKNQLSQQTGSRNLTGPKTLPTIFNIHLYMHIFRRIFLSNYSWQESDSWSQASYRYAILWEAILDPSDSCFLKNQQSRQTGSRNLMDPKMLPTIWGTYMKLVTKYQIPVINSCWEKCDENCAYTNVC
jgi:hypothetical protein